MSYTRFYLTLLFLFLFFSNASFPQTCYGLYGTDANHPNGLFLQLAPAKKYTGSHQNTYPTLISEIFDGSQIIWDSINGLHYIPASSVGSALQTELGGCIPRSANPPSMPPHPVPFSQTPLAEPGIPLALADFNKDGQPDAVVVTPGTNQVTVYMGLFTGGFQSSQLTLGNATSKFTAVGVADFNNDKKLDIAVVDTVNNVVTIVFGKGDGTFNSPINIPVGHAPVAILTLDLNGDGNADIAVTNSADNTVSIVRNNGDTTFIPAQSYPVGKNPVSMIAQDINGDGLQDLIVADYGSSDLAVLVGTANGGYQTAQFIKTPSPPTYLTSADFTDDGLADVVALATDANAVMMFTNSFGGKLNFTGSFLVPNLSASLSVNDFDGDGNLDLLVADTDSGSAVLLLGRGDGTLNAPPVYGFSSAVTSLATGDFNGDGKADLVTTGSNSTTSTLSLLTGMGNGQFQAPVNIPFSGPTNMVAVGDFNNDGRPDLAVLGSQLGILLNQPSSAFVAAGQYPAVTPNIVADLNKDGRVDIAGIFNGNLGVMLGNGDGSFRPVSSFAAGTNPKTAVTADFNHDGSPDIAVLNAGNANGDPGGVSILLGNGTGTFRSAASVSAGFNPKAIAAGDLNGDSKADLVVAGATTAGGSTYQIQVLLSVGDGTFTTGQAIPIQAGDTPGSLALLDLDGDGFLDIVLADCCADAATAYFKGNGDGTFQPSTTTYAGNNVQRIVVGDWNGDGKPDMAMAYSSATAPNVSAVTVLTNHVTNTPALTNTSGASFQRGPLAPDSIVAAFGPALTTDTATASGDPSSLPTVLGGTSVTIKDSKGVSRLAPLYFVSPTQINYLIPAAAALGPATVSVTAPNGVTAAPVNLIATTPGIFTTGGTTLAAGSGIHVRGTQQSAFNISFVDPVTGFTSAIPIDLGTSSDQVYLLLYGTGIRNRSSLDQVSVSIGGVYTPAVYAGPQAQYPGLDQLNIQIPFSLAGSGKVAINVTVNGVTSNTVYVFVQ